MAATLLRREKTVDSVDYADIQGLVRFGYGKMPEAYYLLLNIKDPAAVREWLKNAPITTAVEMKPPPRTALQIAFTRQGLEKLGVPHNIIMEFSAAFVSGMAGEENRSRRLGDTNANAPQKWRWGGTGNVPDIVLMLFAETGLLQERRGSIEDRWWHDAFEEMDCLRTSVSDGREPFGFHDGISQPDIDWERTRKPPKNRSQVSYGNTVALGEFLLGYSNEYGEYTDRPLLSPQDPGSEELREAEDNPLQKDLGLNGTYVVIRQLQQDVRGFWQFLDKLANQDRATRYRLAESIVGRRLTDGAPLVPLGSIAIEGVGHRGDHSDRTLDIERNQFTYESSMSSHHCPAGAHVRRANPRNADVPAANSGWLSQMIQLFGFGNADIRADLTASTRFHRILRRGREYGDQISPEDALQAATPAETPRGLHFVAVNANIERQFEFIQEAWMMRTKFDCLLDESDPLMGNRAAVRGCADTATFSLPQESGVCHRVAGMPQFVTVRGGAYFFLPSIRVLKYLSKIGQRGA